MVSARGCRDGSAARSAGTPGPCVSPSPEQPATSAPPCSIAWRLRARTSWSVSPADPGDAEQRDRVGRDRPDRGRRPSAAHRVPAGGCGRPPRVRLPAPARRRLPAAAGWARHALSAPCANLGQIIGKWAAPVRTDNGHGADAGYPRFFACSDVTVLSRAGAEGAKHDQKGGPGFPHWPTPEEGTPERGDATGSWKDDGRALTPAQKTQTMASLARAHEEGMRNWIRCVRATGTDAEKRLAREKPLPPGW